VAGKKKPAATPALLSPEVTPPVTPDDAPLEAAGDPSVRPEPGFPVVGIGASAGGLAAIEAFFSAMPPDTENGAAFVIVQHLDPHHKSILIDLVKKYTRMPVYVVEDGMEVQPNCVYIIPPNRDMAFLNGKLQLLEPGAPRGLRLPIDFFFRSLAQDQHERAICVVLSGTGSDGTLGLRAVKGEGGMAMVQAPESAGYDGMPRSAITTGLADYVLPPEKMPEQLIAYVRHVFDRRPRLITLPPKKAVDALQKVFILLRAHTGHDFSLYKPNTIHRRIERRMTLARIENLEDYVRYLRESPLELDALFRELLIRVTRFFRDQEAFVSLQEHVIRPLFASRPPGVIVRIWVPGCSTGEEAYSLAILVREHLDETRLISEVQIFATDIDAEAIERARAGVYPDSIAADVAPEWLARHFVHDQESSSYRISKGIRDMVVFAKQDVLRDPPFSRLDLISCRNVLIYLDTEAQKKVLPLFHYALSQDGYLFLGNSETTGASAGLFAVADKKWRIYQRQGVVAPRAALAPYAPPLAVDVAARRPSPAQSAGARELAEQVLLEAYLPTSVLVNPEFEVLYIHGHTGKYLELPAGKASLNLLSMAREELRLQLAGSARKALAQQAPVRHDGIQIKSNGDTSVVNLIVQPVTSPEAARGLLLVIFEDVTPAERPDAASAPSLGDEEQQRFRTMERELSAKQEYLQNTLEELETTNEELKSLSEELQSSNEELQSTNEELETSREELQSINEELVTVNAELQEKVGELSHANNDMTNMLAGTNIGILFLDLGMRIRRFTPAAIPLISLIQTDIGRPLSDIASRFMGYDRLVRDARAVLDTLVPYEAAVQSLDGQWFQMRIQPYRTLENVIEGTVLTFVDITGRRRTEEALRESEERQRDLLATIPDPTWLKDAEGHFLTVNAAWCRFVGRTADQAVGRTESDILPSEVAERHRHDDLEVLRLSAEVRTEEVLKGQDGNSVWFETVRRPIHDGKGAVVGVAGIARDITQRKNALEGLRRLAVVARDSNDAITVQDLEGRILAWNPRAERLYGWSEAEALAMNIREVVPESQRKGALAQVRSLVRKEKLGPLQMQRITRDGRVVDVWLTATVLVNETGEPYAIATTEREMGRPSP